jgi:tetratricopeptide (TPR) repeat protein
MGPGAPIDSLFHPDSRALLIGKEDEFSFWDVETRQLLRRLRRDAPQYPGYVAFSPDGKLLALEMAPGIVHLKEVATGRTVARLEDPHGDRTTWMAFTPDGTRLVTVAVYARAVHVWDLRAIRARLKTMGLDWEWPAFSAGEDGDTGRPRHGAPRLRVVVADAETHLSLGNALAARGQLAEAVMEYSKAIELTPKNAVVWINRGNAQSSLGHDDEAVADYTRAVELEPKHPYAWSNRGVANANLRRWDKAIADFSRSIQINPAVPWPWFARALVRLERGDRAGYRKDCAAMRRQFGATANPDSVNWTVWTCIQHPDAVDDWTKLVQWAEKVLAADPNDFVRLTTLGAVLYRAGRFDDAVRRLTEAEAAFKKAKARFSTIAYTWLFLAMTEERRGHARQARQWQAIAAREIEQPSAERANDPGVGTWNRRLTLRLLRSEAEALLKIDKPGKKEPSPDAGDS